MLYVAILSLIFIVGLCIGSFLNVVILRSLSSESIAFPASKCPKCQHKLFWWHNIPIISYILLRGKCGFCGEKISIQYPIVELLSGIMFTLVFLKFGISFDTIFAWIIGCLFIVIAGTDWKEKVVFDVHTYSLIGTGLLYGILVTAFDLYQFHKITGGFNFTPEWFAGNPITSTLLGIILGFVIMEIIARIGYLIAGSRAFGEGDSFIAAGLGAVFGWKMLLVILVLSVIIQVIITLPVYVKKEIVNRNWMVIISLGAFAIYTVAFLMAIQFGWLTNTIAYVLSAIVLAVIGIFACREVLRGIREPENRTYLPFGPALILAGFLILLI